MTQPDGEPSAPANRKRLNSWKEISAHLGRSVRTVQRWEEELGLPVHRLSGRRRDIVFAYPEELETWWAANSALVFENGAAVEARPPATEVEAEEELEEAAAAESNAQEVPSQRRTWIVWAAAALVVFALAVAAGLALQRKGQPASWRLENNALIVVDTQGRQLWAHHFDFAISDLAYRPEELAKRISPVVVVDDIDGDGRKEFMFLAISASSRNSKFYCFDSKGAIRFSVSSEQNSTARRFGPDEFAPPFVLMQFVVTPGSRGPQKDIWMASFHNLQFPAVVQKFSAQGELKGEYWSNGHVRLLKDAEIGGRRMMLVGATNNESGGASLAVLDYENPSGSAPAEAPKFQCQNCPSGRPIAFLVFPQMELAREFAVRPYVTSSYLDPEGKLTIGVTQVDTYLSGESLPYAVPVLYTLNQQFKVVGAELGDAFRSAHAHLELLGRLKHRLGERDERELFPVLTWNGNSFARISRPLLGAPAVISTSGSRR